MRDKYYFVKNQAVWVGLGIIISLIFSRIPYRRLYKFALPLLVISIILLIAVFLPGIGVQVKGARRWINMGIFVLQASELLKITLMLYLAAWLSNTEKERFAAFLILFFTSIALIALEPDMGTAFIIAVSAVGVYFISGAKMSEMALIFVIAAGAAALLIAIAPYRLARFSSYKNFKSSDLSTTSYQVKQILISLGSGGIGGVGFGKSIQKYAYLPENTADSIFAIYAEEAGFIGGIFLIGIYFFQLFLGFLIAAQCKDKFGKLLAAGIMIFLGIQTLLNLGSQVVLIPLTGVPLPFISYGGSSMLINFASVGILLSISRRS